MMTINHLGTFDVQNYGDLLYPIVFQHILNREDARLRVRQYSFLNGEAPQAAGFETFAVQSLFEPGQVAPRRIVVGGGDILRTDWNVVARHYSRAYPDSSHHLRRSLGTAGRWRYLLRKGLPILKEGKFFADQFRGRWMNYPAAGPFLINPVNLPKDSVVCYLSCGVPHDFTLAEREKVKRTFDQAKFIYLRDEQSSEKLRRTGVQREMLVAPDLIVTLSEQFEHAAEARRGRKILSRLGVETGRPVLCFQSQPLPGFQGQEIIQQLRLYQQRTGSEIVLLPIGYCHGDGEFLQHLMKKSDGAFKYAGVHSVFDVMAVIAASDIFVGTSLHGNITAFSFGIPHLYGPLLVDKAEGFLRVVNLPLELKLRSWRELNDKIDMIKGWDRTFLAGLAREAKAKVYKTVNELLKSLLN